MPIYIFAILAIVRAVQPETSYQPVLGEHGSALAAGPGTAAPSLQLHITPNGTGQRDFGDRLAERLNASVEYHATEEDLERLGSDLPSELVAGLVLPDRPGVRDLSYTVRMDPRLMMSVELWTGVGSCRGQGDNDSLESQFSCPTNSYFYSGFLHLQSQVDALMMEVRWVGVGGGRWGGGLCRGREAGMEGVSGKKIRGVCSELEKLYVYIVRSILYSVKVFSGEQ